MQMSEVASTGIDGLDYILLGGFPRNHVYLLQGDPGVGKSPIAKAMCLYACRHDRRVLYTTCADLLLDLHSSLADGSIRQRLQKYTSPELLLFDDLGYDPLEHEQVR